MKNAYIPFYPSDWLAGTRGMTAAETGVYITLIAMMYERRAPLDMDRARLARLCGSSAANFSRALEALIAADKITETEAGLWNDKVSKVLSGVSEKRTAAIQSANARWSKKHSENNEGADANASETQCETDANQRPKTKVEKEEPNGSSKKRGYRLSADWVLPKDWGDWSVSQGLSEADARNEAAKFRDYWISKPRDAAKLDWEATWRNWTRKAIEDRAKRHHPQQTPKIDKWNRIARAS